MTLRKTLRVLLPAAAIAAMPVATAYAQMAPIMPKFSLGADQRKLSPEEQAKKQQLDDAYKAATNKIPDQRSNDPWADVRQTPAPKNKPQ
jgi:hypothetical protein